jgi:hypothetical protein
MKLKFQICHCEELQKISHANQINKPNDRPRIKSNWAQQKMLAGVGWFSRELPRTPTKFPSKNVFLHISSNHQHREKENC